MIILIKLVSFLLLSVLSFIISVWQRNIAIIRYINMTGPLFREDSNSGILSKERSAS